MNFCTLFDSGYLDRGCVLYQSLENQCQNFMLYVIALDETCENVLRDCGYTNMTVIGLTDFEDEVLLRAKAERSWREYVWTCSSYSIRYVMEHYGLSECTYIDADMYFWSSPEEMLDGFRRSGACAAVIKHGFEAYPENIRMERKAGTYCVEFNTFRNTQEGKKVLDWWISKCLDKCAEKPRQGYFGDQKYLDEMVRLFPGIYEYPEPGAGVAPWNIDRFVTDESCGMKERNSGETVKLIFYHFHELSLWDEHEADIGVFTRPGPHDEQLVYKLYREYIGTLLKKRRELKEKYGMTWDMKSEPVSIRMIFEYLAQPNPAFLFRKIRKTVFEKKKNRMHF